MEYLAKALQLDIELLHILLIALLVVVFSASTVLFIALKPVDEPSGNRVDNEYSKRGDL